MRVFICQNFRRINGLSYENRPKAEVDAEREKIKAYIKSLHPDVTFFYQDQADPGDLNDFKMKHPSAIDGMFSLSMDLGCLSVFTPQDLVVFSKDHYLDRNNDIIIQAVSYYGIPYIYMKD